MIKPFADDEGASAIGELSIENGTATMVISGSLAVTRDKAGLERARELKRLADSIVAQLEAVGDLPDGVEPPQRSADTVDNPFA